MYRRIVAVWISLAMVFGFIVIVDVTMDIIINVGGTTLYVNTTGSGGAYTKIQDAIDNASDGDTIYVYNGTYNESLKVNKTVNLNGENNNSTIIYGSGFDDVVTITADWVNITDFTISNSGHTVDDAGIQLNYVLNCKIFNNNLSGNDLDIYLYNSSEINISFNAMLSQKMRLRGSHRNNIENNYMTNETFYCWIQSSNSNRFINNTGFGIMMDFSRYNYISNNTMTNLGINIWGDLIEHWNTHTIGTSNSINSKPIYYWKNQTAGTIPNDAAQVILANCTDIKIENLENLYGHKSIALGFSSNNTIINNNITPSLYSYGIYISNSDDNNITSNNASYTGQGIALHRSSRNNISKNTVLNNSNYGISISAGSNNILFYNTIFSNRWSGLYISSSATIIYNNNISFNGEGIYLSSAINNKIYSNTFLNNGNEIEPGIGIYIRSSSENKIFNNSFSNNHNLVPLSRTGIEIRTSSNNTIYNNSINSNLQYGMTLYSSSHNKIFNNRIWDHFAIGIYLYSSSLNTISKNNIWYNSYGIYLEKSEYNILHENRISTHPTAIHIEISNNNTISNNFIISNGFGLHIISSSKNSINYNDILFSNVGLNIWSSSSENLISYNNIYLNVNKGIDISMNSNRNNITYNLIFDHNNYGIYISSSIQNRIYHNNFDDNFYQAYDDTNNGNQWDNGYPSGGNYWSDYNGIDLNSTPTQDVPPPDGIGDTPYIIDPDSRDNYPLIDPIENYIFLKYGWNLISIPLIQVDQRVTKVLDIIDDYYDAVQWYDNTDLNDPWKHHKVGKQFGNDLSELNETKGFWIHITQPGDTIFLYNGTPPTSNQTITLHPGWNMVGYPSLTSYNRTEGLNNLTFGQEVDLIQWHDAVTQTWHDMGEEDYFVSGRGYWVHVQVECEWEVPL